MKNKFVRFIVSVSLATLLSYGILCVVWVVWFILSGGTIAFFPVMQTVLVFQFILNVLTAGVTILLQD